MSHLLHRRSGAARPERLFIVGLLVLLAWQLALQIALVPNPPGPSRLDYARSLQSDALGFVWFDNLKPPVTYLVHAVLVKAFGIEAFLSGLSPMLAVALQNALGLYALYRAGRLLGVRPYFAGGLLLLLGILLTQVTFWRTGQHYDHLSFAPSAALIWAFAHLATTPRIATALLAALAGVIVVLQNTIFAAVVPVMGAVLWIASQRRNRLLPWAIAILLPFGAGLGVSTKTFLNSGVFAPSTLGGMARMLVSLRAVDREPGQLRATAETLDLPDWWLWCFDNAIPVGSANATGENARIHLSTSVAAGFCAPLTVYEDTHWPLDLGQLRAKVAQFDDPEPLQAIDADILLTTTDRAQQSGFAPELKLRWVELYTAKGAALHAAHRTENPRLYLNTYLRLAEKYAISEGPRFPAMIWSSLGASTDRFLGQVMINATVFGTTLLQVASPLLLLFSLWRLTVQLPVSLLRGSTRTARYGVETALGAALLCQLVLFATLVGEENARYYLYALPFATFLLLCLVPQKTKTSV